MKKLNLFLIFALMVVFIPIVSHAEKTEDQSKGTSIPTLTNSESEGANQEMNKERSDSQERDKEKKDQEKEGQEMDKEKQDQEKDVQEKDHEINKEEKDNNEKDIEGDKKDVSGDKNESESENEKEVSKRSEERTNNVKEAVQKLVKSVSKVKGIGEQVKIIAQEQNKIQGEAEDAVKEAAQRGGLLKFIVGPDYQKLKEAENKTNEYTKKIKEIKQIGDKITAVNISAAIDAQIQVLEKVKASLDAEIENQKTGFSLFGWLNRLFVK